METKERLIRVAVAIIIVCAVLLALFKYASWEKKDCQDDSARNGWVIVQVFAIFSIIVLSTATLAVVYTWIGF